MKEKVWTQLSRKRLFDSPYFVVDKDETVFPDGNVGDYFVLQPGQSAMVIPQVSADEFVVIRQFRYPVQKFSIEFPAGARDANEEAHAAAVRELKEETGIEAVELKKIGRFAVAPSRSTQYSTVYLAQDLTFGEAANDPDEDIEVLRVSRSEIAQMILDGIITDGPTLAAWALFLNHETQ
jgi:8-oxo-dGTP pyrophosphatase MutT (NUDIX family)